MAGAASSPEEAFLREALLALGGRRPGLAAAAGAVGDWGRVLALARASSVAESVWAGVAGSGEEGLLPPAVRDDLREEHEAAVARNALLLAEAVRIQGALAADGVESVIVKGPGLVVAHYPDVGARHVGDVDVLVRERDAARAELCLVRAGARAPAPIVQHDGTLRAPGQMWGRGEIGLPLPSGVLVELQDRIAGGAGDGSDVDGVLARARAVSWNGRSLRVPSVEDMALDACLHVFDHHGGDDRFVARHLADLAVLFGPGGVAWDVIEASARGREAPVALAFSRELLERGPPAASRVLLEATRARARGWSHVTAGRGPGGASAFRMAFPARSYMADRYGVPERSPLLPLLYLWRPVRGLWRLVSGK